MIVKPEKMDFSKKNILMILSGLPGTGKTTLALSAQNVLLIDTDEGLCRVNPKHRKDASICKTYEDILADIEDAKGVYNTLVIDTAGALIDYMIDWVVRNEPKARKTTGGISLQGFGYVKQEFLRLCNELRKSFNVLFIFHEKIEKVGEDSRYTIICSGSAKEIVYMPADLAAHCFITNGQRYLGFTPTEQYTAKGAYGIKGIVSIPELKDGDKNDFLEKLFDLVRKNLAKESEQAASEKGAYNAVMADGSALIAEIEKPEDVEIVLKAIDKLPHALTSKKELIASLKAKLATLNITYNQASKTYVYANGAAV